MRLLAAFFLAGAVLIFGQGFPIAPVGGGPGGGGGGNCDATAIAANTIIKSTGTACASAGITSNGTTVDAGAQAIVTTGNIRGAQINATASTRAYLATGTNGGYIARNDGPFCWVVDTNAGGGTIDTCHWRISPGISSVGNATPGDFSGGLKLTSVNFLTFANVGTATEFAAYYNSTATTGVTRLELREGAGQVQSSLLRFRNAANSDIADINIGSSVFELANTSSNFAIDISSQIAFKSGSNFFTSSPTGGLRSNAFESVNGTKFTTSGCSVSSTTGGSSAGNFTLGANSCTVVVTINGATGLTAPNSWDCSAHDVTAPTIAIGTTTLSATQASFTIPITAGATDVISFHCIGY